MHQFINFLAVLSITKFNAFNVGWKRMLQAPSWHVRAEAAPSWQTRSGYCTILTNPVRMLHHPDRLCQDTAPSWQTMLGWCTILTDQVRILHYPDKPSRDAALSWQTLSGYCTILTNQVRMVHHPDRPSRDTAPSIQTRSGCFSILADQESSCRTLNTMAPLLVLFQTKRRYLYIRHRQQVIIQNIGL